MPDRIGRTAKRHQATAPTPAMLALISARFKALAEPARLALLHALQDGERAVGDLVEITGLSFANVSKHLQQLNAAGFVTRRKEGLYVYYALADTDILALCDIMCTRVEAHVRAQGEALAG